MSTVVGTVSQNALSLQIAGSSPSPTAQGNVAGLVQPSAFSIAFRLTASIAQALQFNVTGVKQGVAGSPSGGTIGYPG
jgi:hypothetical protein